MRLLSGFSSTQNRLFSSTAVFVFLVVPAQKTGKSQLGRGPRNILKSRNEKISEESKTKKKVNWGKMNQSSYLLAKILLLLY